MDINSLIYNYIKANGRENDLESITETVKNIARDVQNCDSIFEYGEDASLEEFIDYFTKAAGKDDDAFKEDISLLYEILDADGDGTLTTAEMKELQNTASGDHKGKIDGFGIWNELLCANAEKVNSSAVPDDESAPASGTGETGSTGETGNTNTPVDENKGWSQEVADLRKELNDLLTTGKTPEEIISYWLQEGKIDSDMADELRSSYTEYSKEDEEKIQQQLKLMRSTNPDATRKDAIDYLNKNGEIGDPVKDANTPYVSKNATKGEAAIANNADRLYNAIKGDNTGGWWGFGTNTEVLDSIMNDPSLSAADVANILLAYPGGLASDIDTEWGLDASKKQEYYDFIVDNLLEAAQNGSQEAILALCKEIENGTAGQTCSTADEFMATLFSKIDDETLYAVATSYGVDQLRQDIKNDYQNGGIFGWIAGTNSTGKAYLDRIDKAISACG